MKNAEAGVKSPRLGGYDGGARVLVVAKAGRESAEDVDAVKCASWEYDGSEDRGRFLSTFMSGGTGVSTGAVFRIDVVEEWTACTQHWQRLLGRQL